MGKLSTCFLKFQAMSPLVFLFLLNLTSLFIKTLSSGVGGVNPSRTNAHIAVMGLVYCDICSNNSFSRHSYFMPGAEVRIECKFKASSSKTSEELQFSGNRTTNRYGMYKLDIPAVDGVACTESTITSSCVATLIWTSAKSCNIPGYKSTSSNIQFKARQSNSCYYTLYALNFRPPKIDSALCGH